jgi:hypothetical protein
MELTAKFDGGFAGEPQTRAGTGTITERQWLRIIPVLRRKH